MLQISPRLLYRITIWMRIVLPCLCFILILKWFEVVLLNTSLIASWLFYDGKSILSKHFSKSLSLWNRLQTWLTIEKLSLKIGLANCSPTHRIESSLPHPSWSIRNPCLGRHEPQLGLICSISKLWLVWLSTSCYRVIHHAELLLDLAH